MGYQLEMVHEVRDWLHNLRRSVRTTALLVGEAVAALLQEGPILGRPLVDRIKNSNLHNLKELRPASSGSSEVRILFLFDPERRAVLLVAGDKSGRWTNWYREAIPLAEARYAVYLKERLP